MDPKDTLTPIPVCPTIVVSKCLGFEACRYNAEKIPNPFLESLAPHAHLLPVCPEVEIGLGTPRDPIRLVGAPKGSVQLVQPSSGRDLTGLMNDFSRSFLGSLGEVDGFVLKSASPSCAVKDSKHFSSADGGPSLGKRPGLFAEHVLQRFPDLPVEDEGRLRNLQLREHFLIRVFTLARFKTVLKRGGMRSLVHFHSSHKLLLMAYNQVRMREMGRVVANADRLPAKEVFIRYQKLLCQALGKMPRNASNVNVLMHGLGYVSDHLDSKEKAHFLDMLSQFTQRRVPLSTPLAILRSWIIRFEVDYLLGQVYFEPFPAQLFSLRDSGRGRAVT